MRTPPRLPHALLALLVAARLAAAAPTPGAAAVAAAPAVPTDRLIITLNPSSATGAQIASSPALAADALSDEAGADLSYVRPFGAEAHVLSLDAPRPYAEVEAIAQRLAATPEVLAARPDAILLPSSEPTDPGYSAFTWHLWPVAAGNYGANLPPAWEITTGAPSIVTAVIDTGGLLSHEDLAGRTLAGNPGYDMISSASAANDGDERDPNPSDPGDYVTAAEARPGCGSRNSSWHGSHVGGTIGARANNGKGTAGINWGSPLLFVRALGKCGGYLSDIADGMRWAAGLPVAGLPTNPNPARVLNLSLGAPSNTCDSFFQDAISAVTAAGAVVVVAAGNENTSAADAQPGNCAGVITVAATARNGDRAWYSNYGAAVEIAAPGGDTSVDSAIYSTIDSGARGPEADAYGRYQGTSMATPHVAGIVSLMLSANPALTPSQVLQILQSTAAPFPAGSDCIGACGAGLIDAGAAVEEAARLVRTASFRSSSTAASEGGPAVSLPITLSIASNQTVSVPFTVAGSAGASDHTLAAGSVSFAPGDTSADLSFSITEDDLVEGGETIVVSLGSSTRAGRGALSTHTITIEDNDAAAAIVLTPASLSLGEQQVGSSGATRVITISNPGVLPLTIGNLAITGDFGRQGGSCPSSYPSTIAVGASCTVNVRFAPTRLGRRAGGLLVTSDVAGGPHAVPLSGTGTTAAIGFGPASLSFPGQIVGGSSASQTITLTNPGTAPLTINEVVASGDYLVASDACAQPAPTTLEPGASCAVGVSFAPQASGARAGLLTVASDAPGGPYSARLSGEGLAPALSLDAAGLDFGGQQAGTSASPRMVTVTNRGGATLTLSAIAVSGAAFARAGGSCPALPATLAPGASCTVGVGFGPALAQTYGGTLTVTGDAPGGPTAIALAGTGTAGPAASPMLAPYGLTFTEQVLPALSATRTVTISNQGGAAMTVSGITVSGAGFATAGGSCGTPPKSLAPGASCTVGVSLTGAATGAYSGSLTVTSDAPGGPQVAPLVGSIVAGPGTFAIETLAASGDPNTVTVRLTVGRGAPAEGAASIGYSLVGTREATDTDLPLAAGSVSFAPGETSASVSVSLARLGLYGVTEIVLSLDKPVSGVAPAGLRTVAVPTAWYSTYAPFSWR